MNPLTVELFFFPENVSLRSGSVSKECMYKERASVQVFLNYPTRAHTVLASCSGLEASAKKVVSFLLF